jgi:hypothetical protein
MAYMTACEMPDFFYSGTERIFCRKEIQGLRLFPLPGLPLFVWDAVWARENVISSQKHLTPWARMIGAVKGVIIPHAQC